MNIRNDNLFKKNIQFSSEYQREKNINIIPVNMINDKKEQKPVIELKKIYRHNDVSINNQQENQNKRRVFINIKNKHTIRKKYITINNNESKEKSIDKRVNTPIKYINYELIKNDTFNGSQNHNENERNDNILRTEIGLIEDNVLNNNNQNIYNINEPTEKIIQPFLDEQKNIQYNQKYNFDINNYEFNANNNYMNNTNNIIYQKTKQQNNFNFNKQNNNTYNVYNMNRTLITKSNYETNNYTQINNESNDINNNSNKHKSRSLSEGNRKKNNNNRLDINNSFNNSISNIKQNFNQNISTQNAIQNIQQIQQFNNMGVQQFNNNNFISNYSPVLYNNFAQFSEFNNNLQNFNSLYF